MLRSSSMCRSLFLAALAVVYTTALQARESVDTYLFAETPHIKEKPWFTGPLLTPSGHVVPEGHVNYEPYVYWTQATGKYDPRWHAHKHPTFNNVLTQLTFQIGVLPGVEFDVAPQFVYNSTQHKHHWRVSDIPITLAFQVLYDHKRYWYPGIKLRLGANVPLGKYDHLDPKQLGTDIGGIGTWYPNISLVLTKLYHFGGIHFLSWRFATQYAIGSPINVEGLSTYGGSPKLPGLGQTRGTLYPGNVFLLLGSIEYSLTQRWVFALDVQYQHTNKTRFSGRTPPLTAPTAPSKELFALAPAIEYNWSSNLGIIAGPWFSVAGRNTQKFISYVVAINIYN